MTQWPSTKARRVYAALLSVGWQLKRQAGSHRTLSRPGYPDFVFAFHDSEEIGPRMLARIAKHTGISPDDLRREMANNEFESGVNHRGPRLAAAHAAVAAGSTGR